MPDVPKVDMEKIRQVYGSLRRQRDLYKNERFHRVAIAVLALTGFIGWIFFGHLRSLLIIAVIYFIVAVARGYITFQGLRPNERPRGSEDFKSDGGERSDLP